MEMTRFNAGAEYVLTNDNIWARTWNKFWGKMCVAYGCIHLQNKLPREWLTTGAV